MPFFKTRAVGDTEWILLDERADALITKRLLYISKMAQFPRSAMKKANIDANAAAIVVKVSMGLRGLGTAITHISAAVVILEVFIDLSNISQWEKRYFDCKFRVKQVDILTPARRILRKSSCVRFLIRLSWKGPLESISLLRGERDIVVGLARSLLDCWLLSWLD